MNGHHNPGRTVYQADSSITVRAISTLQIQYLAISGARFKFIR